ncbi:MAG: endospore germination permease [Eubacteriales bacterium]|jgi:spore germination protein KB
MLDIVKLDGRQVTYMLIINLIGEGLLFAPAASFLFAGQDAWISNIVALIGGLASAFFWVSLSRRFPGKTSFEIFEILFGRFFGKIIGFYFAWGWFNFTCDTLREVFSLLSSSFMSRTPLIVFLIMGVILTTYAAYSGLENIARITQIILPLTFGALIVLFVLSTPKMEFSNLLPVLERGFLPVFKGSLAPMFWFCQVIEISILLPFLNRPEKALGISIKAIAFSFLGYELVALGIMAVLGPALCSVTYAPALYSSRIISLGNVVERMEIFIMIIWIASGIVKIAMYQWTIALGSAQMLGLKNYRPLVVPIGILLVSFSVLLHPNIVHLFDFMNFVWGGPYGLLYLLIWPFLFLLYAVVLGKGNDQKA